MKLPGINYGQVQGLATPNIAQEAESAMLPAKYATELAETTYETVDHFEILRDQELALEQANESGRVAGVIANLGEEKVSASSLPTEIVDAYRNQEDYDAGQSGWIDGDEVISSHKVAQATYDWANKEINNIQGKVKSNRQQGMYGEALGKTLSNAFTKAGAGIRSSQIQALSDQTDIAIMNSNAANNPTLSLKLIDDGYNAGIFTPAGLEKREKATIDYFQERITEEMLQIEIAIETAEVDGEEAAAESLKDKHNKSVAYWKSVDPRMIPDEQANKYARSFRSAQVKGELSSAIDTSLESVGGVEAGKATVLKMMKEQDIPDGMTPTDYNNLLNQQLNRVNQRKNMLTDSGDGVADQLKIWNANKSLNAVFESGGKVPKSGQLNKDYNIAYDAKFEEINNNIALTPEQKRTNRYNLMMTAGRLPKEESNVFDSVRFQSFAAQVETVRDYVEFKQRSNGNLTSQYTGENKAYLEYLAKEVRSGGGGRDLELAIEEASKIFVEDKFSDEYKTNIEINAKNLKPDVVAKHLDKLVEGHFDYEILRAAPQVTALYKNAWEHNYRDNLGKGATVTEAVTTANDEVKSVFDVDFSDKRHPNGKLAVMPMSIEGPWVQEQFDTVVTDMFPDLVEAYGVEAFYSEADGLTTTSTDPSWVIRVRTGPGNASGFQPVVNPDQAGDGVSRAARFRPDFFKTKEFKEEKAQQEADIRSGEYYKEVNALIVQEVEKLAGEGGAPNTLAGGFKRAFSRGKAMPADVELVIERVKKLLKGDPYFQTTVDGKPGTVFDTKAWNEAIKVITKSTEAADNTINKRRKVVRRPLGDELGPITEKGKRQWK